MCKVLSVVANKSGIHLFQHGSLAWGYIHNVFKQHFEIHPFQKDSPGAEISSIAVQYAEAACPGFYPL